MTSAAEARARIQPREPRCRICRDSHVRRLVNDLLDLRGAPAIVVGGNKGRRITYTDILGWLEPLNEGRDEHDRITYSSLWIHAKRHHDFEGIAAYWESQMVKELRHALRRSGRRPIEQQRAGCSKYEKFHGHRDCAYRYVEHDLALRSRA
jgi:hypothetical protein